MNLLRLKDYKQNSLEGLTSLHYVQFMHKSYRDVLKDIYELRRKRNPAYSIAAFSRDAGFKSYHMSDILHGRYGLSPRRAVEVAQNLQMNQELREEFLHLVSVNGSKSPLDQQAARTSLENFKFDADKIIGSENFGPISEWYYMAILELVRKDDFQNDANWIAEKLNIEPDVAANALQTLIAQQFIQVEDGHPEVNFELIAVRNSQPAPVIRKFHKAMISKSLTSMEADPVTERSFNSFNVLLTEEDYANLTVELASFIRKKIVTYQKHKTEASRLYAINSQIFPLEVVNKRSAL